MIKAISDALSDLVRRFLPDPLVFALMLSVLIFVLGVLFTPHKPADMINMWGGGFWNLLGFSMQMSMVLVTGHALASSAPASRLMARIASIAKTPAQAVMLVTFASALANLINWGFGLVVGAMFAREVARRVPKCDYRLLIASAYIGFMTWHGGLSGSVPLAAATKGNPVEGAAGGVIPLSDTLLSPFNLFITTALVLTLPFLTRMMTPPPDQAVSLDPKALAEDHAARPATGVQATVAEKIERNPVLAYAVAAFAIGYLFVYFQRGGAQLNINTINLIFLAAGFVLHGSPVAYMRAVVAAARHTAGIILQYPFYAGIQAMLEQSGLGGLITSGFVAIANHSTFPILAFLSSGLINFAVPSGGGQWVVQGPYIMPAAHALGVNPAKAAMAIAYGEEWMNMAQPFWALPALSIAGLGIRDIMGYCVTALLFSAVIFLVGLYFF